MALQFLLEGLRLGERGLYVTLSETKDELRAVAASHGWSLDGMALVELSAIEEQLAANAQNTLLHPSELELTQTTKLIIDQIEAANPQRVVFDSLSEMRLLAQSPLRYRRQLLAFKQFFAQRRCTVLLLDDGASTAEDEQVQSLAHGVVQLEQLRPEYGAERRRLSVVKIRGSKFRGGFHDYCIRSGGLEVFPRLVAAEHHTDFEIERVASGVPALDQMLGGGMTRGTSNLLIGPAGSGKSTIAMQYVLASAKRGEVTRYFMFDENLGTLMARAKLLGLDLREQVDRGTLEVRQIDPAEVSPGEFAMLVRRAVEEDHARVIVIDSLNGYFQAMPEERFLLVQLHELLSYLSQQGVLTIMVLAQHGMIGKMEASVDLTYLADAVVMLRYFEAKGTVRKAISVIKNRSGPHEGTIREVKIGEGGVTVGEPLVEFHGVLTGVPTFVGSEAKMMGSTDANQG